MTIAPVIHRVAIHRHRVRLKLDLAAKNFVRTLMWVGILRGEDKTVYMIALDYQRRRSQIVGRDYLSLPVKTDPRFGTNWRDFKRAWETIRDNGLKATEFMDAQFAFFSEANAAKPGIPPFPMPNQIHGQKAIDRYDAHCVRKQRRGIAKAVTMQDKEAVEFVVGTLGRPVEEIAEDDLFSSFLPSNMLIVDGKRNDC